MILRTKESCSVCLCDINDSGGNISTGLCLFHELQEVKRGRNEEVFWREMQGHSDIESGNLAEAQAIINGY
jgi:hypothetical protein